MTTSYTALWVLEKNCKTHWEYIKVWSKQPDNTSLVEAVIRDNLSEDKEIIISNNNHRIILVYNNNTYRSYAKHV